MPIKSFRGLIADGGIDTITLHTNNGATGYRIVKLDLIGSTPGTQDIESVVKIYKVPQETADGNIDLSDNTLVAVAYYGDHSNSTAQAFDVIVFDNEVFNQDIYITHKDASTGEAINYYIELEQISLNLNENTVATLKDIRNQS